MHESDFSLIIHHMDEIRESQSIADFQVRDNGVNVTLQNERMSIVFLHNSASNPGIRDGYAILKTNNPGGFQVAAVVMRNNEAITEEIISQALRQIAEDL